MPEAKVFGLMFLDVFFGPRDDKRLGVALLQHDLIAEQRKVLREDGQQFYHRVVLFAGNHAG